MLLFQSGLQLNLSDTQTEQNTTVVLPEEHNNKNITYITYKQKTRKILNASLILRKVLKTKQSDLCFS